MIAEAFGAIIGSVIKLFLLLFRVLVSGKREEARSFESRNLALKTAQEFGRLFIETSCFDFEA